MQKPRMMILPVLVSTVAIVALTMTPTLAKDSQNKKSVHSSAKTAADTAGHAPEQRDALKVDHQGSNPSPVWKTIGGTAKNVHGDIYTVEDYEGNQVTLQVGQGTKHVNKKRSGIPSAQK